MSQIDGNRAAASGLDTGVINRPATDELFQRVRAMTCPHCRSTSLVRSHGSVTCLPCGYVLEERERKAWDPGSNSPVHGRGDERDLPLWPEEEPLRR